MIKSLGLKNFRGFDSHILTFRPRTLVVGQNNAGKSTLVEALRIVSLVLDRVPTAAVRNPPNWADAPLLHQGIKPSAEGVGIQKDALFHRYGDPPAVIDAVFSTGASVKIYIGPELEVHATFFDSAKKVCRSAAAIKKLKLPSVKILPQIGPLRDDEVLLGPDYVRQNESSTRSSLHFRNQLFYNSGRKEALNKVLEETWPGVVVGRLERQRRQRDELLKLIIRDHDFSSEVAWMGSGLQMWLQMAWFLARVEGSDTIILDEPDVYMHADVQRRLVRLLHKRGAGSQVIIATHSPEIMSEVEPESILIVDKRKNRSSYASDGSVAQAVLQKLGSVHNLGFARLGSYGRILFVEGDDVIHLKRLQNIVDPGARVPIDLLPCMSLGGWSGIPTAVGVGLMLKELRVSQIKGFVIVDRDYRTDSKIAEQQALVAGAGLHLHVWKRKEIENYFIIPSAIARCTSALGSVPVTTADIEGMLNSICDTMRESLLCALTDEALREDRAKGAGKASVAAARIIDATWGAGRQCMAVSGKELMSRLFAELNKVYSVNMSLGKVAEFIHRDEVDPEVVDLFAVIYADMG